MGGERRAVKRFYLAEVDGRIVQVTAEGMTNAREVEKVIDRVKRWMLVTAATLPEAKGKFRRGDGMWFS